MEIKERSKAARITILLCALGSGVVVACLLSLVMLYYYNPTGEYRAESVLLNPQNLLSMRFQEDSRRSGPGIFIFDKMVFTYYDNSIRQWQHQPVELSKYAQFYTLVEADKSLVSVSDEIRNLFYRQHSASLTFLVRPENNVKDGAQTITFMQVDVAEKNDYYRVHLRAHGSGQANDDGWAYFYHPGVYEKTAELLGAIE